MRAESERGRVGRGADVVTFRILPDSLDLSSNGEWPGVGADAVKSKDSLS